MNKIPDALLKAIDYSTLSPMMQQYVGIKKQHPDCLVFFRLGDFYELFFDDAVIASGELEIALTARDCGQKEKAPMCGVPYHAYESYVSKLIKKNYKVAICEQLEDPSKCSNIVKRGLIRIITPGTVLDGEQLEGERHNFLLSLFEKEGCYGIAAADLSTGDFRCSQIIRGEKEERLISEIYRYRACEIICNESCYENLKIYSGRIGGCLMNVYPDAFFDVLSYEERIKSDDCGRNNYSLWPLAAAGILRYTEQTQFEIPVYLKKPKYEESKDCLYMNAETVRHLELVENASEGKKYGSLLWLLDDCRTAMGQRKLREWIEKPLLSEREINFRLDAVSALRDDFICRSDIRSCLREVRDLIRLGAKLSRTKVNPRELLALAYSLKELPEIKKTLSALPSKALSHVAERIQDHADFIKLIENAINEDAPLLLKDGNVIKSGFSDEVDEIRELAGGGLEKLRAYEEAEKEKSGIKNLKLGSNRVFGYYIEVTKSNLDLVPDYFIRKQTLVNAERYITPELKALEDRILAAQQRLSALEYDCFCKVRDEAQKDADRIMRTAEAVSELDVLASLAEVAEREGYRRPFLTAKHILDIREGRHPILEKILPDGAFVANDLNMDGKGRRLALITGPNMGGKSTYMRQAALIIIMAQMGSFVPAEYAEIGITDSIFTRIGAGDDLISGESTFMMEMKELSHIMREAGPGSFILLDEIGRGTSTFDGLSIAWAAVEFLANNESIKARTAFATHFHELTELSETSEGIFNLHCSVLRKGKDISFLHKIEEGGADESYGIEVARLAGIPASVVERASEILLMLENANGRKRRLKTKAGVQVVQGEQDLFSAEIRLRELDVLAEKLASLDIESLSPLRALNILDELSKEAGRLK